MRSVPVVESSTSAPAFVSAPTVTNAEAILKCLELCAGSAGFTAALIKLGFIGLAIDHKKNRHSVKAACAVVNLAEPGGQSIVWDAMLKLIIFMLFIAPPCGTASLAREIPLSRHQRAQGAPTPRPLCDEAYPLGFPWLRGIDKVKVETANRIYKFTAEICEARLVERKFFCVENPSGSWMWKIWYFAQLLAKPGVFVIDLQACMFGSTRPKWTRFVTNCPEFAAMGKHCDGSHTHATWGVQKDRGANKWSFKTAEEAEYPAEMCRALAACVARAAVRCGHTAYAYDQQPDLSSAPVNKRMRIGAGVQARGASVPQLVSEYKNIITVKVTREVFASLKVGTLAPSKLSQIPAKVLHVFERGGRGEDPGCEVALGIYRSPDEFVAEALKSVHPFDSVCTVPDELRVNLFHILTEGREQVSRDRAIAMRDLAALVKANAPEDEKILSAMPQAMRKVMEGKKLFTLKQLLLKFEYDDAKIADEIAQGFELVGMPPASGIFREGATLPSISIEELKSSSAWVRKPIIMSTRSSGDDATDRLVWEQTIEERDQGWLQGPFSEDQVDSMFPDGWCVARRFGLKQGQKTRNIDDLTEAGVNSAFGAAERLSLMGLDAISAFVKLSATCLSDEGWVTIPLTNGTVLKKKLHSTWTDEEARSWLGRSLDLAKAYRQLAFKPSGRWAGVVSVFDPVARRAALFPSVAMLFGGTSAVYAFNRASRCLWFLGCRLLRVVWFCYYDDYPMLELEALSKTAHLGVELMMKLLGWKYAEEGSKNKPFDVSFETLGAVIVLSHLPIGEAFVTNKPERIENLKVTLQDALAGKGISKPEADSIRGRLQYAESHCFGRIAARVLRVLGKSGLGSQGPSEAKSRLAESLQWLLARLSSAEPRPLIPDCNWAVVHVFTDAASEGELNTCGGVIYDTANPRFKEFFGMKISEELIREWRSSGIEQIITHAELYPVWVARCLWANVLPGRRCVFWVDNNGAKDSLVKGSIRSAAGEGLVMAIIGQEFSQRSWQWYARVPTHSNVSDKPSRLDFVKLLASGFVRLEPVQPVSFLKGEPRF